MQYLKRQQEWVPFSGHENWVAISKDGDLDKGQTNVHPDSLAYRLPPDEEGWRVYALPEEWGVFLFVARHMGWAGPYRHCDGCGEEFPANKLRLKITGLSGQWLCEHCSNENERREGK
ncbi:MAG: hypothetical protein DRG39_05665 [Deltaproteobacteria bacterium]|nr:MAG: hypothetical protein DRG39_05665 [Deltaproteobacteria bacterium]